MTQPAETAVISINDLIIQLGKHVILKNLNLDIQQGEVLGIVGGSGSGKTTLLRAILGLIPVQSGSIKLFNQELTTASAAERLKMQRRFGVLFQQNALFSSLTLLENIAFPLREQTNLDETSIEELARLKIALAGLPADAAEKYPAELSGGMQKRAGIARAIALDPELIFLDEPTAGLDPQTAAGFDDLILNLQETMNLTIVMVTHDLDSLWKITDRVAFLGRGIVLCVDHLRNLITQDDPLIEKFFNGPRGRIAQINYQEENKDDGN